MMHLDGLHRRAGGAWARTLEEGVAREGFVWAPAPVLPAAAARRRRRRIAGAAALALALCVGAVLLARAALESAVLLGVGAGGCGTAADVAVHLGAPRALARAVAPALLCVNGTAMWAPRELAREGLQRSQESSPWCATHVALRASTLTLEARGYAGPLGARRMHVLRGAQAACAQRALEYFAGDDPPCA